MNDDPQTQYVNSAIEYLILMTYKFAITVVSFNKSRRTRSKDALTQFQVIANINENSKMQFARRPVKLSMQYLRTLISDA